MKRLLRSKLVLSLAAFLMIAAAIVIPLSSSIRHSHAAAPQVLILASSVTPGTATDGSGKSLEQQQAEADGFTVTLATDAQWDAMTASQFATYQALVIGDPTCQGDESYAAAQTNASVWEPVVMASGGNKVLIGTDATLHNTGPGGTQRGDLLEAKGIAFAGAVAGATGAYVDTSCEFSDSDPVDGAAPPGTPVPIMDGLSTHGPHQFTAGGAPCAGSISIVASSGPTSGLHDADLSNWSCSVHAFFDHFPSDWTVLALATDPTVPQTYSATDVDTGATVSGSPYILLSGSGITVKSNISLTPASATNPVGGSHTVTANVLKGGSPEAGKTVTFSIDSGPNVGAVGTCSPITCATDVNGQVTFTYVDSGGVGTDSISATFVDDAGALEKATATKTWAAATSSPAKTGALTMGFWQNKNGQGIISGGASTSGVCNSGTWLRHYAPFQDLSATASCSAVATYVYNVIKAANASGSSMNAMLKAQMLATALDVYFSDSSLGSNKINAPAPIGGVKIDLTKICTDIPTCTTFVDVSSAFGANSLTVSQMLTYAASQSNVGGTMWYGNVKATQQLAKDAFDAINNQVAFAL